MANEQREFSFTTNPLSLGEAEVDIGPSGQQTQTDSDLQSHTNATFEDGTIKPDYAPSGIVSQWLYNDNSDTTAITDSIGSITGTINGPTYTTTSAEGSYALDFNASNNDWVNWGDPPELSMTNLADSYTVFTYFYSRSSPNGNADFIGPMYGTGGGNSVLILWLSNQTGNLEWYHDDGSNNRLTIPDSDWSTETWCGAAARYDGSTVEFRLYDTAVNLQGSDSTSAGTVTSAGSGAVWSQGKQINDDQPWDGIADAPFVADSALAWTAIEDYMRLM